MNKPNRVNLGHLLRGPIRHESLSNDLLEQIAAIHEVIGWILETTLEQFEINFMRDEDPEAEVALWSFITAAWIDYHDRISMVRILSLTREATVGQLDPDFHRCQRSARVELADRRWIEAASMLRHN